MASGRGRFAATGMKGHLGGLCKGWLLCPTRFRDLGRVSGLDCFRFLCLGHGHASPSHFTMFITLNIPANSATTFRQTPLNSEAHVGFGWEQEQAQGKEQEQEEKEKQQRQ